MGVYITLKVNWPKVAIRTPSVNGSGLYIVSEQQMILTQCLLVIVAVLHINNYIINFHWIIFTLANGSLIPSLHSSLSLTSVSRLPVEI